MALLFFGFVACADGPPQRAVEAASQGSLSGSLPALTLAWAQDVGGRGAQSIRDVAAGSTRAFVVGSWVRTVDLHDGHVRSATDGAEHPFVAAVDAAGQPIWLRAFPAVGALTRAVVTQGENVVVAGTRAAEENVGCGPIAQPGGFLAKYDGATGLCLWMRVWPSSQPYSISAVRTEANGDLVVVGSFAGSLDLGNGNVVVNASANPQVFLARLDSRGHALWAEVLGDPSANGTVAITATDLSTDESGDVLVVGELEGPARIGQVINSQGGIVIYLASFDGMTGRGGFQPFHATGWGPLAIDTKGGLTAVVGASFAPFEFAFQQFDGRGLSVLFFAPSGFGWAKVLGGTAAMEAAKLVVDEAGDVNVLGTFTDGDVVVGNSTFVATDASTQRGLSVVLNPSDGAPLAANAWGDDGARVENARLSFGPSGLRLMTVDLVGPNHLDATAVGSADPDGAVVDFTPQSPPGTTPAFQVGWTKDVVGPGDREAGDVFAGATRSFVTGRGVSTLSRNRNSGFVAAIDASGATIWNRGFEPGVSFGRVIGTPEEDAIVVGGRPGPEDVGCGPVTAAEDDPGSTFLAKYAGASGLCLWMRVWLSSGDFPIDDIAMEPDDEIAVTGRFVGTVDLGGGHVIVNDSEQPQVFVARLSNRGHAIWTRILGDPSAGSETNISEVGLGTDASGNIYLAGQTRLRTDFDGEIVDRGPDTNLTYVLSIDGAGALRWLYLDDEGKVAPTSIDARAGHLAVSGGLSAPFVFAGQTVSRGGLAVLDFDLDGSQRWASVFGSLSGHGFARAEQVAIDVDGSVAVTGTFESQAQIDEPNTTILQLGRQSFVPYGNADINVRAGTSPFWGFVVVLDAADGQVLRANSFGARLAFVFSPRISFGSTGLKLMAVSLSGMVPFGGLIFGETERSGNFDGVFMSLNP